MRKYSRLYVGHKQDLSRETFRSTSRPTNESHPQFLYVTGPFKTKRGAGYFAKYPVKGPVCLSVAMAEKLANESL